MVRIRNRPLRFAPSVETVTVDYRITDAGNLATSARIEVLDQAGTVVAYVTGIPFAAGDRTATWDGRINQGARAGQWIGPTDAPLRLRVQVDPGGANAANSAYASVGVVVASVQVTYTPAAAATSLRIYKPAVGAAHTDQELLATVRLRKSDGTAVVTAVPIRVDWSFHAEAANAAKAKGGKDNTDAHFTAAPLHPANGGLLIDANTITNGTGESRIIFRASVTSGDMFTVRASVLRAPGGAALGHGDSARLEVWKRLHYTSLYRMQTGADSGVDVDTLCVVANVQPAYTPAFTEYDKGAANPIAYNEFVSALVVPLAAQLPNKSTVRVRSDGPDIRAVTIHGLVVAANGTTSLGTEVITLNGTTNVTGATEFQRVDRATVAADPARTVTVEEGTGAHRAIGSIAPHHGNANFHFLFDTAANVHTNAQAWADANQVQWPTDLQALNTTIGAPSFHMVGCGWLHPKHAGAHSVRTTYYTAYNAAVTIAIRGQNFHPDDPWNNWDGMNMGQMSCLFRNMLDSHGLASAYAIGVARHEIGHSSDHVQYGAGDHCPQSTCLMYATSTQGMFCTIGADHSLHRTMGWTP